VFSGDSCCAVTLPVSLSTRGLVESLAVLFLVKQYLVSAKAQFVRDGFFTTLRKTPVFDF